MFFTPIVHRFLVSCALASGTLFVLSSSVQAGPRTTLPLPQDIAREVSYPAGAVTSITETIKEKKNDYEVRRVTIPVILVAKGTRSTIAFDYYRPTSSTPLPTIIILPITGGGYRLERNLAAHFLSLGYAAIIVDRDREIDENPENGKEINAILRQGIVNNRHVIDWIEMRPELDASRIGVMGTSMGAIKGAMLAALDKRVRASVLALAGGDIPSILIETDEPRIARKREQLLAKRGISADELRGELSQAITLDPAILAPYVDRDRVLLMLASYDTTVPYSSGMLLRERLGNPETIFLPTGHLTAIFYIQRVKSKAGEFFRKQLGSAK